MTLTHTALASGANFKVTDFPPAPNQIWQILLHDSYLLKTHVLHHCSTSQKGLTCHCKYISSRCHWRPFPDRKSAKTYWKQLRLFTNPSDLQLVACRPDLDRRSCECKTYIYIYHSWWLTVVQLIGDWYVCMYAYIYSDIHTVKSRISSLPLPLYYILYTILYYTNAHIEINTQWQHQAVKWALGKIKYFKGEFPPHAEPWVWCQRYSQTFCLSSQSLCCGVRWCNGRRSQTQLHSLNEYESIEWRVGGKVCVNAAVHWLEPQSLDRRRVEL